MGCIYKLGKQTFNSELALEEYLLNINKYVENFNDEVFLYTDSLHKINHILQDSDKLRKKLYKEGKYHREVSSTDFFEDNYKVDKPYFGANELLRNYTFKDAQGVEKHLFPIFNIDEYIKHKYIDWKDLNYWLNKASKEEILDIFGEDEPRAITYSELEGIKEKLLKKWAYQSIFGTAVHNAMNLWWNAKTSEKKNVDTFVQYLKSHLLGLVPNSDKSYKELLGDDNNDTKWREIAEHCFKVEAELKQKFGADCMFLSEVGLTALANYPVGEKSLVIGVADLIIIDKNGKIQIFDYKTSPKVYGDYNSAKKRTFHYLLALYRRMVLNLGINVDSDSGVYVIPFLFENFRFNPEKNYYDYDHLISESYNETTKTNNRSYFEELPILLGDNAAGIRRHLDDLLPLEPTEDLRTEGSIAENVDNFTKQCFPSYSQERDLSDKKIIKRIEKYNGFEKDKGTNKYSYKIHRQVIYKDTKEELIEAVRIELLNEKNQTLDITLGLKRLIKAGLEGGDIKIGTTYTLSKYASELWIYDQLSRYSNKDWNIIDGDPILEELGIILIENRWNHLVNVIKVSNTTWQDLTDEVLLGGDSLTDSKNTRHTLTGYFESDIIQKQRPKSLVLDSTYGNIELMLTMEILNSMPNLFKNNEKALGDVIVINPRHLLGMATSNKLLLYNYNELKKLSDAKYKQKSFNNFLNGNIKCLTFLELVKKLLEEIFNRDDNDASMLNSTKWNNFKTCINKLDDFINNPIRLRAELIDIASKMEKEFGLNKVKTNSFKLSDEPERVLYYNIHMAIAEIDGVDFTLQVVDHDKYFATTKIWKGISGTSIDNPGLMPSETLNSITKQVNVAYQNVRNDLQSLNSKLRKLVNDLKKSKNFNYIYSRTIGNQTNLYTNLYDTSIKDDLVFKNPFDERVLFDSETEREFLKFALLQLTIDKYKLSVLEAKNKIIEELQNNPLEILQVPLTIGSTASQMATRGVRGMLQTIKDKFKSLMPKQLLNTVREKVEGYLVEDSDTLKARTGEMWHMINSFDAGYGNRRQETINNVLKNHPSLGLNYFEHNLETLVLKHRAAYSLKKNLDLVFPTIKAAMLHLSMQGIILNDKFELDITYLQNFIKNKIFNLSILDDKWKPINYVAGKIMKTASRLALAFSPIQLYQALDGIWKDISLYIRKPDGNTSFTAKNLKDAFFWIYKDLIHFGNNKSMAELFNEQYGLNDMDMNTLVDRIHSDNVGIWNFWSIAFRFASRPDFYNRLTIFNAQMRGDGCFEAHSIKDGKLYYDWTKDNRFSEFAKYKNENEAKNKELYLKQKALYIATAKQFMAEHAVNEDGTEFVLDLDKKYALPRAYTTQQSESMKSLSDLIYGYYSHEKKALVQSTTLGALIMLMNTYWSSKKNLWLAPGGVKLMGKMELYEDEQGKWWVELDEEGNPTGNPTLTNTGVPFMLWKGLYQEGIIITVCNIIKDWYTGDEDGNHNLFNVFSKYWNNEDDNLKRAYQNNLKLLLYDLFAGLLLGAIVSPALMNATKAHIKDVGNDSFSDAFVNNCMFNMATMFDSSTNDFNAVNALFGRSILWTPFAVKSMTRVFDNLSSLVTGNKDLYDVAINLAAATRTLRPLLDYVKLSTLGRAIGDNGKDDEE